MKPEKQTIIRKWAGWLLVILALVRVGSIATDGLLVHEPTANTAHASAQDDAQDVPVLKAAIESEAVVPLIPVLVPVLLVILVIQFVLLQAPRPFFPSVPRFALSYFRNLFPHAITAQAP
ncbi:hypothetical protein [Catalinimonas alkaloidigena]|uniref:hypothetical protein n=1 Tax=Catalinimonas alkaloidigena TaxID=1075417 RepID=UPI00115FB6D8|nr:hypothetical protein [Catalinimonas alkaloidigena]